MAIVTFFGHKDAPKEIEPIIKSTLTYLIENENADVFYVGNNGNFDNMVRRQLKSLSEIYPINYDVVLAYLPRNKNENADMSDTVYPEGLECVPPRFAISWRNKWMLDKSDYVITYVTHSVGGSAKFKEMAIKKNKRVIEINDIKTDIRN